MGIARTVAIGVGGLLGLLVVVGGGGYLWASNSATTKLAATHDVHRVDFPIPFPLADSELAELRAERSASAPKGAKGGDVLAGVDVNALATERAVARGKHLIESFYACAECHGADFGGGVMVDEPATIGRLLGQNLTLGTGSRTLKYTAADWDRMVRHGVKPDGTGSPMPSKDFFAMSDRELSDIVSYIRSLPPVNKEVPPVTLGPVGKVLVATGQFKLSAELHPTKHVIEHAALPPAAVADATFGKHLAQTCTGCHRENFSGGPIIGGPPDWPPARNLTPTGLTGYTYEDFVRVLREGKRKNGDVLLEPMASMPKFAKNMTDIELKALWSYIKDLPPQPTGK
ncbi:MAG: c-type cytochrome [Gemmatimonadaceae bacterium]|nr:c-type cytochrome [Gemmatimonadaceae bacterium]